MCLMVRLTNGMDTIEVSMWYRFGGRWSNNLVVRHLGLKKSMWDRGLQAYKVYDLHHAVQQILDWANALGDYKEYPADYGDGKDIAACKAAFDAELSRREVVIVRCPTTAA